MNTIVYKMRLDCSKSGSQASIYTKKGDVKSRELSMFLYNGSEPYEIEEGSLVVLRAVKPDGTLVYTDCTVAGNVIKKIMPAQMMAVAGTVACELDVYGVGGEEVLFSPEFNVYVSEPLTSDDDIASSDEFSALTHALTSVQTTETAVEEAEILRAAAETERATAEGTRAAAETLRGTAETARDTSEGARAAAETERATAEGTRAAAETLRGTAETARDTSEGARAAAETERATAEGTRAAAETARASAESSRASAEADRASAEEARISSETTRASSEESRITAEQERVTAEGGRATAESTRTQSEGSRVTAEAARVAAEQDRASQFDIVLSNASDYADNAAAAAASAYTSEANASSAKQAAETAEANAETALAQAVAAGNAAVIAQNNASSSASAAAISATRAVEAANRVMADRHYTVRWDKVNAQMVRLNSAEGITTDTTNFRHNGSKNTNLNNPFDVIYPWSAITLCNIDIDDYYALTSGADIKSCVTAWLGNPDFSYTHTDGVWRYRPEFWYKVWDDGIYRYFDVSPIALPDYIHAEEAIEGRWHGGVYTREIDGTSKSCLIPRAGMPGKNIAMSTLHTYAKNYGASVEDIYLYDANDVLMLVEYATMNTQNAIGNGVSSLYRQSSDLIQADATSSATVKVLKSAADACIVGAIFDIGTANGGAQVGSFIISAVNDDPDDATLEIITLTTDGTTAASVTVTTANFWSVHGLSNVADSDIGAASGYIGANSRSIAYYRGQEAFGNMWRYVLGAYRQTGTGHIWIANSRAEADAYDALDVSVHKDTGLALPQGDGGAAREGYIQTLHLCEDVPAAPFCESVGGSSANPVGDYFYTPALTAGNTILLVGASADYRASVGRFYGSWSHPAGRSGWYVAAVPVLKNS